MDKQDVLKYLRAKKQEKMRYIVTLASIVTLVLYILLRLNFVEFPYMDALAAGVFLGGVLGNSDIIKWGNITKSELLDIIERQVNSDPEALKYFSDKNA